MLVNDNSIKKDTQFIPNKPLICDEKLLHLYREYNKDKKFTRLNISDPVVSFEPAVTRRLKPAKFALAFITNLQSDLFVENVELINRKNKFGNGIAGRADAGYLYGWVADNTYRFAVMLLSRVLHVIEYNTETLEAKDITNEVDLTVVELFPFGYDNFAAVEVSAVYYDMASGYFFVFQRMTSIFGNGDYGNNERGKPRGEYATNVLGMRGYNSQRTKEMEVVAKALNFYGGILTEGDMPIVSNELAALWRSSIDSARTLPNPIVNDNILAGRVSNEIYESGDVNRLVLNHSVPMYDYDEPPF